MSRYHCNIHGNYDDPFGRGCPGCQEAAERTDEQRHDLLQTLATTAEISVASAEHAAYLANNPGDHECPSCKMVSLKDGASRCPMCRELVPAGYWQQVHEAVERARRRAEVKQRQWLASPAYALEVKQKAETQKEYRRQKVRNRRKRLLVSTTVGLLLIVPALAAIALTFAVDGLGESKLMLRFVGGGALAFGILICFSRSAEQAD